MNSTVEGYKQPSRVAALDSARGWAILGVIAVHVSLIAPLPPAGLLHSLVVHGDMGVELFYVLSAFSLTMMLHAREIAGHNDLIGYFIRRFFRIAPMFWIAVVLATLVFFGKPSFWSPNGFGWVEVAMTAIFLHGIRPEWINAVVPGGWSVAVEVMFYLMLPLLYKFSKTTVSTAMWLLIGVGICLWLGGVAQAHFDQSLPANAQHLSGIYSWYMSFPAQLPVFLMGILAFLVFAKGGVKPVYGYAVSFLGGLLLLALPVSSESHMLPRHLMWGGVFAMFIIALVQRPIFLFDNPLLRIFGRISYSAYLLHFFVLLMVGKVFRYATAQAEIKFVLLYFVVVGITYFLASWSYRFIELPGMRMGSEFSRRFEIGLIEPKKELYGK